ncbi:DUF4199 domain-containing protein [Pedobacter frigidisoli]|uniref:DUF4199 domain-containing protein n=1 Tax=Pedobacter frigidisoli TaxID=2530455 RepID=A0A4R0NQQ9_9SPHI|nr:DUF4199 domain-containing protein [Pedobacter frigidisoli]TCD02133.1 DUF4199 domain-containing protein [Pedobacter frigidisoli]
MKKTVIVFGLIAGLIVTSLMAFSIAKCYNNQDFEGSMILGYAAMVLAFSFIFVGIKNHRDKYNDGTITFVKGFKIGLLITIIASSIYVIVWLVEYYFFIPDFMDKYVEHMLLETKKSGANATEMAKQTQELAEYKEMYNNPLLVVLFTYMEILPVGIIISTISALILKRKQNVSLSPM